MVALIKILENLSEFEKKLIYKHFFLIQKFFFERIDDKYSKIELSSEKKRCVTLFITKFIHIFELIKQKFCLLFIVNKQSLILIHICNDLKKI